jgi:hypothetical protein
MFYITEENATKFWQYLEGELDRWEADTRMSDDLAKRLETWTYLDSFSLQWQATLNAKTIAIRQLRQYIKDARSGAETYNGELIIVAEIDSLLRDCLGNHANGSSFTAANLVIDMAEEMKRNLIGEVFRFSIKAERGN